jgi:MYXO-CTERM domain-containing protein
VRGGGCACSLAEGASVPSLTPWWAGVFALLLLRRRHNRPPGA